MFLGTSYLLKGLIMNPFLGLLIISVGSISAASFYVPLNKVKNWAWETFYLSHGVVAWIITPLIAALFATPHLIQVYTNSPPKVIAATLALGVLWGVGALTFGLSMRYLGLSLGYAIALGSCAVAGTIIPSIMQGQFVPMFTQWPNAVVLIGILISVGGIGICGWAGIMKEKDLTDDQKKESVKDFHLFKGLAVAIVSGVMASCFAIALSAGKEIADVAVQYGASHLYKNNTIFLLITIAGFFTNLVWCLFLGIKNRTTKQYTQGSPAMLLKNYSLTSLAGFLWYAQFIFYGMGITKLGQYDFTAWSMHIALIIALSNLWGIKHGEWKGISKANWTILWAGIITLVASAVVIGLGNYLLANA